MLNFADNLRRALERTGKTAPWLAAQLELSPQSIYGWLQGMEPTLRNAQRAAVALGITPLELFNPPDIADALAVGQAVMSLSPQRRASVLQFASYLLSLEMRDANPMDMPAHSQRLNRIQQLMQDATPGA